MGKHNLLRLYARVSGVGLVLLGISGALLNLPNTPLVVDIFRLLAGFALFYAALSRCRAWHCRAIVAGSGLLFLMVGMIGPAEALLDTAPIASYEGTAEAWLRVTFGLLSISVASLVDEDESSPPSPSERDS